MTTPWRVADPGAVERDCLQKMQAFRQAFRELENRIKIFVRLPISSLERMKLQQKIQEIGQTSLEHNQPTSME